MYSVGWILICNLSLNLYACKHNGPRGDFPKRIMQTPSAAVIFTD